VYVKVGGGREERRRGADHHHHHPPLRYFPYNVSDDGCNSSRSRRKEREARGCNNSNQPGCGNIKIPLVFFLLDLLVSS